MSKIFGLLHHQPVGEGTGLGLATVYGIVKQSDGWISVDWARRGAAFRIFLPVHIQRDRRGARRRGAKRPVARPLGDRISSWRMRTPCAASQPSCCAPAATRSSGRQRQEALELAEPRRTIDLMISDVVMPGMQGPDLLKQAQLSGLSAGDVHLGYAESEFSDLLEGEVNVSFLPKPIDIKTLAERVKQELQKAA